MTWVNQCYVNDATDQVRMVSTAPIGTAIAHDGLLYISATQAFHCNAGAVDDSTDVWHNGRRFKSDGAMRIVASNGTLPAGTTFNAGFAISPTGQQCVNAAGTVAERLGGWPVTSLGEIIVTIAGGGN